MRPISKVLLLSMVLFLLTFLALFADQPSSEFDPKSQKGEKRDLIRERDYEPIPGYLSNYPFMFDLGKQFDTSLVRMPAKQGIPEFQLDGSFVNLPSQSFFEIVADDFLVNDDTSGGCTQDDPVIGQDASGNFAVAWEDERCANSDIYVQRFDSAGTPLGFNLKVNDDTGPANQSRPDIAMNASGRFIITWREERNGWSNPDVYAQRYSSSGTPLGSNFKVNDDTGTDYQSDPTIAIDNAGNFVIAWVDGREGKYDIYAQRFDSLATPIGSNFEVNDDTGNARPMYPAIDIDSSGNFIVVWKDFRNGEYPYSLDFYAQRYSFGGVPLGPNFRVNDQILSVHGISSPTIAISDIGKAIIAWPDTNSDIQVRMFDDSGVPIGPSFRVNDVAGSHFFVSIAADGLGHFVITWTAMNVPWDILAQRFDSSGTPIGSNFQVDDGGPEWKSSSAIAMDGIGGFVITWHDWRNGDYPSYNPDIYAQRYDSSGTPLGSNYNVINDAGSTDQLAPGIAVGGDDFIITWYDTRNGGGWSDIYAQRYNFSGTPLGSNFKVNDGKTTTYEHPEVAMDSSGNSLICWRDLRDYDWSIYAQRYDSSGIASGSNFKVNDDTGERVYNPYCAMDCSGKFTITWEDLRTFHDIYAQRYDSLGTPLDTNFMVNDDIGDTDHWIPRIAGNCSRQSVITWFDHRTGDICVYAQRYDSSGIPIGSNFKVNDSYRTYSYWGCDVAMDFSGNFVITWTDCELGYFDIYAQRYDSSGAAVGPNFKVNDDAGEYLQWYPTIAYDDMGNFVIGWGDYRNGDWDFYAQIFDRLGNPVGNNFLVTDPMFASFSQINGDVAAGDSGIYFTWTDNRRCKGWDIYAKIMRLKMRGDVNDNGKVDIVDVVYIINYLYKEGPEPVPEILAGDTNCDNDISISDAIYLIQYMFRFGPTPMCF